MKMIGKRLLAGMLFLSFGWVPFSGVSAEEIRGAQARKAIDLSDQFVFTPNDLDLDAFTLDTDLKWSWVPDSFEWVRVDRKFLVPRARARLEVPAGTVVRVLDHAFRSESGEVEVPVILTREKGNFLEVMLSKPVRIGVRFKPVKKITPALVLDGSCSQVPLKFDHLKFDHSWAYVFCRAVHPKAGAIGFSMRMDLEIRWETEGSGSRATLNGLELESTDGVTHEVSFVPGADHHQLSKGSDSFEVAVPTPERFHPFWFSVGIGPYSHRNVLRAFPTFYAGYYFNDGMRIASFSAIPIKSDPEIDTGLYLVAEQFRGIDERISVSLLLGAHLLGFTDGGIRYSRMSAPQGVELGFRDFLQRSQNLTFGGFFYPLISNRFYINSWVRYGNSKLFGELNFINWQEPTPSGTFTSKSLGLSIGFPLFRAL